MTEVRAAPEAPEAGPGRAAPPAPGLAAAVLSPVGRDASLIVEALAAADIEAFSVPSAPELLRLLSGEVEGSAPPRIGVVLATDEALGVDWSSRLVELLDRQPPWSDLPVVLLAGSGGADAAFRVGTIAERLSLRGSLTVLDRPVRAAVLVSAVRAAMRARGRQMEVRELIQHRDRAVADAERANQVKSEYLAVMSHELRTPLNAISGHVQLIEMGVHGAVTPEQQDALQRVDQAQRHVLHIVNDLLDYARIEAGRLEYDLGPVRLAEVVDEVGAIIEAELTGKGLTYAARLPEEEVVVRADQGRLRQVLINLLSNGAKFTEPGGRVELVVAEADPAADMIRIEVRDDGIGIPEESLDGIFEPFVQAHGGRAQGGHRGTGLGLPISREMVRSMGGELTVSSTVGKGSTFVVTLPQG